MSTAAAMEPKSADPKRRPSTPAPRPILQRRASHSAVPEAAPDGVHRTLSAPGRPLDGGTRGFMESRFGHDFSQVRIHTDSHAGESARAINAHAYTAGSDIAFAPGKYQPDSHSGRHLLAHELAHTIQQGGLQRRASDLAVDTAPDSRLEAEADRAAHEVVYGASVPIIASRLPQRIVSRAIDPSRAPSVSPTQVVKLKAAGFEEMEPPPKEFGDIRRFKVLKPFPLPDKKGKVEDFWNKRAVAGGLEAIINSSGMARLKQETFSTDAKRSSWLTKVGWAPGTAAAKNWKTAGGDTASFDPPQAAGETCDFDHIIELQIGGTNLKENFQVLNPSENRSSGGTIRGILSQTAAEVRAVVPELALKEVVLHWTSVAQVGAALCKGCCAVEQKAVSNSALKPNASSTGDAVEKQPISSGGFKSEVLIGAAYADKKLAVPIADSDLAENKSAATIISGLLLVELNRKKAATTIKAKLDDMGKSRLPITIDPATKPFDLSVAADGTLALPAALKKTAIGFTYKYLSAGSIKSVAMNASGGIDWIGQIKPTAKFLPTLDVKYQNSVLALVAQVPEEKLKKAKLFGAKITRASLDIVLSPTFDVTGNLAFVFGNESKPAGSGQLVLGKDDQGLVGTAKLQLHIPKVDSTEITFEYKGGADREEWMGELRIETSQIKLPYVVASSIVARVHSKGGVTDITFDGKVSLELPGKRGNAEVALRRGGSGWYFSGLARLNLPKIDDFSAGLTYDIAQELITISVPGEDGKTPPKPIGFTLTEDFKGTLERCKLVIHRGGSVKLSGAGGFTFKKGKAAGSVRVELDEKDGSFNGTGDIAYALSENLTVDGKVEFKEKGKPKLRISGSLTFKRLKLMDAISDNRTLFENDFSIPIPGASIGGVGLKAFFEVSLKAGYQLGPIVIEPLIFTAGFNPIDEEPQLDLGASGELKVPAQVFLTASLSGGVKIDALIAEVGGKVTISGTITLKGGLFVPFKGSYSSKEFSVEMTPEARLSLLLGVLLTATVYAKAGVGWLSVRTEKTWELARREVDTGLGFGIKAPISYNSRTGAKIPSPSDITFVPPDFSKENLIRVADKLFGDAKEEEK